MKSIIILTAGALKGDQAKASEIGCSDYQTKPVEFARLSQKIEKLLPENRPA
jgi:two-component system, cell cycle response regulator DivK